MKYKRLLTEAEDYEVFLTGDDAVSDAEIKMGVPINFKQIFTKELLKEVNDRITLNIVRSQNQPSTTLIADILKLAFLRVYSKEENFIEE